MTALVPETEVMKYGARLKKLRTRMGLTQEKMADYLNISRPYYWQLENDQESPGRKLRRSIELLEQAPDGALPRPVQPLATPPGGDVLRDVQITVPRYIPVLTMGQAGDILVAWENFPLHYAEKIPCDNSDPRAFAVKVSGDSGEPLFHEGDTMIVTPSREVVNGDIVLVRLTNGDTLIKLYHTDEKGQEIQLASFNSKYPPRTYSRSAFEAIVPITKVLVDVSMSRLRHRF